MQQVIYYFIHLVFVDLNYIRDFDYGVQRNIDKDYAYYCYCHFHAPYRSDIKSQYLVHIKRHLGEQEVPTEIAQGIGSDQGPERYR